MAVTIEIDTRKLERACLQAPSFMAEHLRKAATRVGKRYMGFHRRRRMVGLSLSPQPGRVRAGGRFRKGFGWDVSGSALSNLTLKMGTKGAVAIRQEHGGVTRARQGKRIVIPMPEALDSRGQPKKKARDYLKQRRLVPIVIRGKTFFGLPQKRKPLRLLWHLQKSVRHSARLGFGKRYEWRSFKPLGMRDFQYGVYAGIRKAFRLSGQ